MAETPDDADEAREADGIDLPGLDAVMQVAPRGAVALAGVAVVLLLLCWLAIYLFVFLPRGSVG